MTTDIYNFDNEIVAYFVNIAFLILSSGVATTLESRCNPKKELYPATPRTIHACSPFLLPISLDLLAYAK